MDDKDVISERTRDGMFKNTEKAVLELRLLNRTRIVQYAERFVLFALRLVPTRSVGTCFNLRRQIRE